MYGGQIILNKKKKKKYLKADMFQYQSTHFT